MKLFTIFIFMLAVGLSHAQDNINKAEKRYELLTPGTNESCDEIKERVAKMASRKEFVSVSYGLIAAPMSQQEAFRNYMRDNYNITFENKGCVVNEHDLCYAAAMNAAITNEFGEDFLRKEYEAFNQN